MEIELQLTLMIRYQSSNRAFCLSLLSVSALSRQSCLAKRPVHTLSSAQHFKWVHDPCTIHHSTTSLDRITRNGELNMRGD